MSDTESVPSRPLTASEIARTRVESSLPYAAEVSVKRVYFSKNPNFRQKSKFRKNNMIHVMLHFLLSAAEYGQWQTKQNFFEFSNSKTKNKNFQQQSKFYIKVEKIKI